MDTPKIADLLDFSGKSVLVTGADRGIGRGIALRFAEAGANVGIHYRSGEENASGVSKRANALGVDSFILRADLRRKDEVDRLIEVFVERFGKIDVLINNAGIYPLKLLLEMDEEEWEATIRSDLTAVFLLTKTTGREMKRAREEHTQERGAIVTIASIEGENPAPYHSHYAAAKGGVIMHTKAAALELGRYNIRVNSVSPGLIWKEGLEEAWPEGVKRYTHSAPLGRLGLPTDVADACLFLSSPASRWITGINLRVDGGVGVTSGY